MREERTGTTHILPSSMLRFYVIVCDLSSLQLQACGIAHNRIQLHLFAQMRLRNSAKSSKIAFVR